MKGSLIKHARFITAALQYLSKPLSKSIATAFKLICKQNEGYK